MSRFGFVFGVRRLCRIPGLARSPYYAWIRARPNARSGPRRALSKKEARSDAR